MSKQRGEMTRRQAIGAGLASGTAIVTGTGRASGSEGLSSNAFILDSEAKLLSADDIREQAIGNTLVGTLYDREDYELFLRPDGTGFLRMSGGRFEKGVWTLEEDGWITSRWPTIADGESLRNRYYLTRPGHYSNLEASSLRWSHFTIEPGNSRDLMV